jgi:hypothetical protein
MGSLSFRVSQKPSFGNQTIHTRILTTTSFDAITEQGCYPTTICDIAASVHWSISRIQRGEFGLLVGPSFVQYAVTSTN